MRDVGFVDDKGRYRQRPESTALETFKRSHLRPRSRVDHSLHPEVFVCSRCSAQLFGQKRGQAETESVPVRLLNRGTGGRKCGEDRARLFMPACPAHRFTAYQTTFAVTPEGCTIPPFRSCLNTLPSVTPECRSHASTSSLDQDGTGTVRSRAPLPTKFTMTQRPSRLHLIEVQTHNFRAPQPTSQQQS